MEPKEDIQPVIEFMIGAHKGQIRKGSGLPYAVHPMAVLSQLADWEIGCYKCWKAGLCHDIREERPDITLEQMIAAIGAESAGIVEELTFIPNPHTGVPDAIQKVNYMKSFGSKSVHALVVKVADRMCNTADFMSTNPSYAPKYWRKADDLFGAMMDRGEEIMKAFGRSSFPRMKYTRTTMSSMLNY
jgi:guanosine-3',5'-bis(diphosphate) 3'-pyrophosphohydrolase